MTPETSSLELHRFNWSGVGGSPVKMKDNLLIKVAGSAGGAGDKPSPVRRSKMNLSTGLLDHPDFSTSGRATVLMGCRLQHFILSAKLDCQPSSLMAGTNERNNPNNERQRREGLFTKK